RLRRGAATAATARLARHAPGTGAASTTAATRSAVATSALATTARCATQRGDSAGRPLLIADSQHPLFVALAFGTGCSGQHALIGHSGAALVYEIAHVHRRLLANDDVVTA